MTKQSGERGSSGKYIAAHRTNKKTYHITLTFLYLADCSYMTQIKLNTFAKHDRSTRSLKGEGTVLASGK